MPDYTSYTTKQSDRWDLIAYAAYGAFKITISDEDGNPKEVDSMDYIIQANRGIPITAELPPGLILKIPIVEFVQTKTESMPPWKR
jgi:hypothetical protein